MKAHKITDKKVLERLEWYARFHDNCFYDLRDAYITSKGNIYYEWDFEKDVESDEYEEWTITHIDHTTLTPKHHSKEIAYILG